MESIPFEVLLKLTLDLPLQDLHRLSLVCKHLQEQIGENEYFWKLKFRRICGAILQTEQWKWACFKFGRIRQYNYNGKWVRDIPEIRAQQISSSHNHTLCLDLEGKVWGWGSSEHGKLPQESFDPILLSEIKAIKVVADENTSYFLSESGYIHFMGINPFTGFSDKTGYASAFPFFGIMKDFSVAKGTVYSVGLPGTIWNIRWGHFSNPNCPGQAKRVFSSGYCDGVILEDGALWHISRNQEGRIIHPQPGSVKEIGFSKDKTILLLEDGQYHLLDLEGTLIHQGVGAHFTSVYEDKIFIWNTKGDVVYSEGVDFPLSNIHQVNLGSNGLDLIFSVK